MFSDSNGEPFFAKAAGAFDRIGFDFEVSNLVSAYATRRLTPAVVQPLLTAGFKAKTFDHAIDADSLIAKTYRWLDDSSALTTKDPS